MAGAGAWVCPARAPPLIGAPFPRGSTLRPQEDDRRSIGGRFRCQEVISWKKRASEIPLSSSNAEDIAVRLTGRPSFPKPHGTAIAGRPHRFPAAPAGSVQATPLKCFSGGKAVKP